MKKNKPEESTSLLGIFISLVIFFGLYHLVFGEHGAINQEELRKAKSYYSQEQQQLIEIVCRDRRSCWRNEEQILQIAGDCRDDINCWEHQREQKILRIEEKCGNNVDCLERENSKFII